MSVKIALCVDREDMYRDKYYSVHFDLELLNYYNENVIFQTITSQTLYHNL